MYRNQGLHIWKNECIIMQYVNNDEDKENEKKRE